MKLVEAAAAQQGRGHFPRMPRERACDGDPQWITDQIDRLAARYAIDRERVWIADWSGGATYIGMRTQEFERTFAALVFHGRGIWPSHVGCAPEHAPATFLIDHDATESRAGCR